MKKLFYLFISILSIAIFSGFVGPDWGFYGHRKINRKAIFTLPTPLNSFYKEHIEYITEHAVDPDKRRYATKHEGVRHYIDIDHWGDYPFDQVPRDWHEAILKYGVFQLANETDTTYYAVSCFDNDSIQHLSLNCNKTFDFFDNSIQSRFYEDEILIPFSEIKAYLKTDDIVKYKEIENVKFEDHFSEYGVLPFHLLQYYRKLVSAFEGRNLKSILRISAEIGHYIGDAHVPLHTTENYNGQFTDQNGIHGFWESRLPELFADETYDFFVGKAQYIEDPKSYFWDVVLNSHSHLDEVLAFEKSLSKSFAQDQQYCFDERLERTIQTQCEPYARAYHNAMDGMVEEQMRASILSIGSVWYSAWLDAGSPEISREAMVAWNEADKKEQEKLEAKFNQGDIKGRGHGR